MSLSQCVKVYWNFNLLSNNSAFILELGDTRHRQRSEGAPCRCHGTDVSPNLQKGVRYMDIQAITTFITTVGFPIAACVALFWQNNKMSETISRNTEAILELTTIIRERLKDGD